jgi:hypothetical protein
MRHAALSLGAAVVVLGMIAGCGDDAETTRHTSTTSLGGAGGSGGSGGSAGSGGVIDPTAACTELGLPSRPFEQAAASSALGAVASDLTIPTTDGDYQLSAHWSGCDSYLFIQDKPAQNAGFPIGIWERDLDKLLAELPRNVELFFASVGTDAAARDASLAVLQGEIAAAFAAMSADDVGWWTPRVHYVTARAQELDGWLGELMTSPRWGVGLDRFQRIRYIGSYADYSRYDSGQGWFAPNIAMVANEPRYYDFEAERETRLDAESATVIQVFTGQVASDPDWAGVTTTADVTLPDAAEMAGYDTLELDLALGCQGDGEFGDCPAWDYDVDLRLCDEADPNVCTTQIGRWITTYHRLGRWVHDVSGFLPLLAAGGQRRFAFYTQQPYELYLSLRLSSAGKAEQPSETLPLWNATVEFNETYNDSFAPITLAIPADAAKVELVTALTGHGMSQPGNCCEFCNTTHTFTVNSTPHVRDFPGAGSAEGCMQQVDAGTVPNQYGTWWYGRGGWCPGKEVPLDSIDITADVLLGQDNLFEYQGLYQGQPYTGNDWRHITLVSAVVISR